jgi:hypothetical protein
MSCRLTLAALALLTFACTKKEDAAPASALAPASAPASASALASASASASALASASAPASPPDLRSFPSTPAGAQALVSELAKPSADPVSLTKQLRPTSADYKAIFDAPTAAKIDAVYSREWDKGSFVVSARPGQTEVKIVSATVADLKAKDDKAKDFPPAYANVAPHLVGAATLYRFEFVEPGKPSGSSYDGLVHVNGHWVLIPQPWRALDGH